MEQSLLRMLHDRSAAAIFDGPEASDAIVKKACEDHANDTRAERVGGGTEQRIDRGPKAILFRSAAEADTPGRFEEQVLIHLRHVDVSGLKLFPILCNGGRQGADALEDAIQNVRARSSHMIDNKNRGFE